MADKLTLVVKSGAMIGEARNVLGQDSTIGGKGSGADFEVSGVAYGIRFAEFRIDGKHWVLEEITQGQTLLNGRRPRRRNQLRNGDILTVPGVRAEDPIDIEMSIERVRGQRNLQIPNPLRGIKPMHAIIGVVYISALVGGGIMLTNSRSNRAALGERSDIATILRTDVERLSNDGAGVMFQTQPRNFDDLRIVVASDLPQEEKNRIVDSFVETMTLRFVQARRAADLGLTSEAREHYETIIALMGSGNLETTRTALRELASVSARRER